MPDTYVRAEEPARTDEQVIDHAVEEALNAGAIVVQNHLGVIDGAVAGEFFELPCRATLRKIFGDYLQAERAFRPQSVEQALTAALKALETMPDSRERANAITWLQDIMKQRGCDGWRWVEQEADGSLNVPARGESDSLTRLISVIIRG